MKPFVWSSRLAAGCAAVVFGWLASIELGSSRTASRDAAARGNVGEKVVDTTTSQLFERAALFHLLVGVGASAVVHVATIRWRRFTYAGGLVLLVTSGLLSVLSRRHLGRFHRDDLTVHDDQMVVDTGPYRYVRHPLYLATGGVLVGSGAMLGNWVSLGTAGVPIAALVHRILIEEQMLVQHLGRSYLAYQDRTTRLLPRIWSSSTLHA